MKRKKDILKEIRQGKKISLKDNVLKTHIVGMTKDKIYTINYLDTSTGKVLIENEKDAQDIAKWLAQSEAIRKTYQNILKNVGFSSYAETIMEDAGLWYDNIGNNIDLNKAQEVINKELPKFARMNALDPLIRVTGSADVLKDIQIDADEVKQFQHACENPEKAFWRLDAVASYSKYIKSIADKVKELINKGWKVDWADIYKDGAIKSIKLLSPDGKHYLCIENIAEPIAFRLKHAGVDKYLINKAKHVGHIYQLPTSSNVYKDIAVKIKQDIKNKYNIDIPENLAYEFAIGNENAAKKLNKLILQKQGFETDPGKIENFIKSNIGNFSSYGIYGNVIKIKTKDSQEIKFYGDKETYNKVKSYINSLEHLQATQSQQNYKKYIIDMSPAVQLKVKYGIDVSDDIYKAQVKMIENPDKAEQIKKELENKLKQKIAEKVVQDYVNRLQIETKGQIKIPSKIKDLAKEYALTGDRKIYEQIEKELKKTNPDLLLKPQIGDSPEWFAEKFRDVFLYNLNKEVQSKLAPVLPIIYTAIETYKSEANATKNFGNIGVEMQRFKDFVEFGKNIGGLGGPVGSVVGAGIGAVMYPLDLVGRAAGKIVYEGVKVIKPEIAEPLAVATELLFPVGIPEDIAKGLRISPKAISIASKELETIAKRYPKKIKILPKDTTLKITPEALKELKKPTVLFKGKKTYLIPASAVDTIVKEAKKNMNTKLGNINLKLPKEIITTKAKKLEIQPTKANIILKDLYVNLPKIEQYIDAMNYLDLYSISTNPVAFKQLEKIEITPAKTKEMTMNFNWVYPRNIADFYKKLFKIAETKDAYKIKTKTMEFIIDKTIARKLNTVFEMPGIVRPIEPSIKNIQIHKFKDRIIVKYPTNWGYLNIIFNKEGKIIGAIKEMLLDYKGIPLVVERGVIKDKSIKSIRLYKQPKQYIKTKVEVGAGIYETTPYLERIKKATYYTERIIYGETITDKYRAVNLGNLYVWVKNDAFNNEKTAKKITMQLEKLQQVRQQRMDLSKKLDIYKNILNSIKPYLKKDVEATKDLQKVIKSNNKTMQLVKQKTISANKVNEEIKEIAQELHATQHYPFYEYKIPKNKLKDAIEIASYTRNKPLIDIIKKTSAVIRLGKVIKALPKIKEINKKKLNIEDIRKMMDIIDSIADIIKIIKDETPLKIRERLDIELKKLVKVKQLLIQLQDLKLRSIELPHIPHIEIPKIEFPTFEPFRSKQPKPSKINNNKIDKREQEILKKIRELLKSMGKTFELI